MLNCHALFGRYLFVKYSRNDLDDPDGISCKDYLYVRSVKGSSAEYNVQYLGNELSWTAGVVDDLYHTGYVSLSMSNRQDCLISLRNRGIMSQEKMNIEFIWYVLNGKKI